MRREKKASKEQVEKKDNETRFRWGGRESINYRPDPFVSQGDEEGALEAYSNEAKSHGMTNKNEISAFSYGNLGRFYWYMGDMFKAKLSYEKALSAWEEFRSANPLKIHNGKMPKDYFLDDLNSKIQEINETSSESNN